MVWRRRGGKNAVACSSGSDGAAAVASDGAAPGADSLSDPVLLDRQRQESPEMDISMFGGGLDAGGAEAFANTLMVAPDRTEVAVVVDRELLVSWYSEPLSQDSSQKRRGTLVESPEFRTLPTPEHALAVCISPCRSFLLFASTPFLVLSKLLTALSICSFRCAADRSIAYCSHHYATENSERFD